jgi:predicted nucleic acid-binding protein
MALKAMSMRAAVTCPRAFEQLVRIAERTPIVHFVRARRDPKDDKFLELAIKEERS